MKQISKSNETELEEKDKHFISEIVNFDEWILRIQILDEMRKETSHD